MKRLTWARARIWNDVLLQMSLTCLSNDRCSSRVTPRLLRTSQRLMSQPASGTDGVPTRWTICLVPKIKTSVLDGLRLKPLWVNQFKTSTLQIFKISSEMFGDFGSTLMKSCYGAAGRRPAVGAKRVEIGVNAIQKWVPFTPKCRPQIARESPIGACQSDTPSWQRC